MGFRRKRGEWDDFISKHRESFVASGVPTYIYTDKLRFLIFLDHGYDEVGFFKSPHETFSSSLMTDEQIEILAKLVGDFIDANYRVAIESRWNRR